MSKQLPTVSYPTIQLELPMSKKVIKYRPFVNREKKVLLLSKDSDDWDSTLETLRSVILSCTFDTVDIKDIPVSDAAYLFIQLRIQSIGNLMQVGTKCQNCEEPIHLNYNLDDVKLDTGGWKSSLIVAPPIGINFKAPTFADLKYATGKDADPEMFMIALIDSIFDDNEVYDISTKTKDEMIDWLGQFNDQQMNLISEHLKGIPTLKQDINYTCPKCGHPHHIHLEGLSDFF